MLAALAVTPAPDLGRSLRPRLPLRHFTLHCSARSLGDPADDALADAFVAEIFRAQRLRVGRCDGVGAAVSAVVSSRVPRADRIVHALVLDGVITRGHGEPRLWPLAEAPGDRELVAIARRVQARMLAASAPGETGSSSRGRLCRGRVPRVRQVLVEGPPLSGLAGEPGRGSHPPPDAEVDPHHGLGVGGPRLRVRLARPLSGGTTHAVLSTRALLQRLRGVLGGEVGVSDPCSGVSSWPASIRAHGLLWPLPAFDLHRRGPAMRRPVSPRAALACVRPLRDVAP